MAQLDGMPVDADDLAVLALTNYGHFTSMRIDDQRVRGLSHHLERLVRDCRTVFDADLDAQRVQELIRRAVGDDTGSFMVRVTIFDPALGMGHPGAMAEPRVLVTTRPAATLPLPPLRVRSVGYRRDMPAVKHVGLFGTLRCRREAQRNGFDDALFIDAGSFISEGGTWNIGFFDGEHVVWPDADCLTGVTMRLLRQVHERTIVAPVGLSAVPDMWAAFVTNAAIGVRAVGAIDDMELNDDHPVVEVLRREYAGIPGEPL